MHWFSVRDYEMGERDEKFVIKQMIITLKWKNQIKHINIKYKKTPSFMLMWMGVSSEA